MQRDYYTQQIQMGTTGVKRFEMAKSKKKVAATPFSADKKKYHVLRDTREQEAGTGWIFSETPNCSGTTTQKLDTGDYTILGHEKEFVIERKGCLSEWARNINEKRFERELERLEEFTHPYIFLEFTIEDIMNWPHKCGIPEDKKKDIKINNFFILKKTTEIMVKYKTKIVFTGKFGRETAASLFKRVMENVKEK